MDTGSSGATRLVVRSQISEQGITQRWDEQEHLIASPTRLVFGAVKSYPVQMSKVRRIILVLLALAFAASLAPQGLRAASADANVEGMTVAVTDMPMSGKCNGCRDDQKAMTCHCNGPMALPATEISLEPPAIEAVRDAPAPISASHTVPPDPDPPRPAIRS